MKKIIYFLTALCLTVASVNAQMLLNERFNYGSTTDTLTNTSIGGTLWKRHSGTGGPIGYLTSSLTYTGYASSGTGGSVQLFNSTASREDANAVINTTTSGSLYVSFLLNVTASGGTVGDYFFHVNDSQGNTISGNFRGKLWIKDGSSAGTFVLGLTKGAAVSSAVFSSNYNLNTTYLVVTKYVFNTATAADDSVYAWVFASGIPTTEPAGQLVATDITSSDLSKVRSVCLRQGSAGVDSVIVDGIRVSTLWANTPLPVQFTSFNAAKSNNTVVLNWATASEMNNDRFEIEKSSDNKNFVTIGDVKGAGNSSLTLNYTFTDMNLLNGTSYYRLKQIDLDGNTSFSKTLIVTNTVAKNISTMLPNPFSNELNIHVNSSVNTPATIELIDMLGKVHYSGVELLSSGDNKININTQQLNNGIYFVRVNINGEVTTQKIIKR